MKKILVRISLLLVLAAIVLILINIYYYDDELSPIWGDKYLIGKENFLNQNTGRYNTLFVGSSKTHYQINPAQFDSIVNNNTKANISSYNFGIDGMLPPESFYVCRHLLENDKLKLKNLVLELDFIKINDIHNAFSWRSIYWINPDTYSDYTSALFKSGASFPFKLRNFALLNAMWMRKLLHPSKYRIVDYYRVHRKVTDSTAMYSGFEPLQREQDFMSYDIAKVNAITAYSKEAFSHFDAWSRQPQNEAFARQLAEITTIAQSKGIRVYYVLPAQWSVQQYQELLPVLYHLPANSKLIMANTQTDTLLYKPENMYDPDHTNAAGAGIYTKDLATEFIKTIRP